MYGPFIMQKNTDKGYQQQTPWVGIANTNQKLMLQAASEFGLTPSSRSRIIKPDGNRQFRTAFVEICKKVGKSVK